MIPITFSVRVPSGSTICFSSMGPLTDYCTTREILMAPLPHEVLDSGSKPKTGQSLILGGLGPQTTSSVATLRNTVSSLLLQYMAWGMRPLSGRDKMSQL